MYRIKVPPKDKKNGMTIHLAAEVMVFKEGVDTAKEERLLDVLGFGDLKDLKRGYTAAQKAKQRSLLKESEPTKKASSKRPASIPKQLSSKKAKKTGQIKSKNSRVEKPEVTAESQAARGDAIRAALVAARTARVGKLHRAAMKELEADGEEEEEEDGPSFDPTDSLSNRIIRHETLSAFQSANSSFTTMKKELRAMHHASLTPGDDNKCCSFIEVVGDTRRVLLPMISKDHLRLPDLDVLATFKVYVAVASDSFFIANMKLGGVKQTKVAVNAEASKSGSSYTLMSDNFLVCHLRDGGPSLAAKDFDLHCVSWREKEDTRCDPVRALHSPV